MHVEPVHGQPLRYRVKSEHLARAFYLVDLRDNQGSGSCDCPDYRIVRSKNIAAGMQLFSRSTQCKHCQAVTKYWMESGLREAARLANGGT